MQDAEVFFCAVEAHAALPAPFVDAVLQRRKLILDLRVARRSFNIFVRGEIVSEFGDSECLPQDDGVDRLEEYISTMVAQGLCLETLGWR